MSNQNLANAIHEKSNTSLCAKALSLRSRRRLRKFRKDERRKTTTKIQEKGGRKTGLASFKNGPHTQARILTKLLKELAERVREIEREACTQAAKGQKALAICPKKRN